MSGSDANHSHLEDGQEENSAKLNDANVEVVSNLEEKAPPSDALHPPPSDAPVHENDDGDVKEAEEEDEIALPKRRRQDSDGDEDEEHFHDAEDEGGISNHRISVDCSRHALVSDISHMPLHRRGR